MVRSRFISFVLLGTIFCSAPASSVLSSRNEQMRKQVSTEVEESDEELQRLLDALGNVDETDSGVGLTRQVTDVGELVSHLATAVLRDSTSPQNAPRAAVVLMLLSALPGVVHGLVSHVRTFTHEAVGLRLDRQIGEIRISGYLTLRTQGNSAGISFSEMNATVRGESIVTNSSLTVPFFEDLLNLNFDFAEDSDHLDIAVAILLAMSLFDG